VEDPGVRFERANEPTMEVTFETAFLLDGAPAGFEDGIPEHEPHLDNPAVHLQFGDARADVRWNGKRLELAIGDALRDLQKRYAQDAPEPVAGKPLSGAAGLPS
jgi:hypothetical protein